MDKTMIMEKYLPYKGLWWKITPPISENGLPMWRISERRDDRMCHVWMFNAFSHSLEDCYLSIKKEFPIEGVSLVDIMKPLQIENNIRLGFNKLHDFKYIPIQGEYMVGGFDPYEKDILELLSVRNHTPKYMGRGFFKVGHIFTNSNGVHLLSILPPSLEEKTYIRYDKEDTWGSRIIESMANMKIVKAPLIELSYEKKPNSLDRLNEFITKKVKEIFKNGK